eukprot:gb/GECH01014628.1/.p1 GENE.gb/GECH01014628.1/~~gb/GECH01014628.1/.p1  ORF type:complete len:245 (+),score=36.93 gb/GECH01014628.1/:1-735(+)
MTLLQQSERDKFSKIDVRLSMANQICFIIGALLLVIGSPLEIPKDYQRQRLSILIGGTSLFVAGSILSIVGSCVTYRWRPNTLMLLCTFSLLAGILILIGSIFFLIANCLVITTVHHLVVIGHIGSIVGALCIVVGVGFHLFSDQLAIYRASPDEGRKYKLINALLLIGGDLYLIGGVTFILGSSVHLANPHGFFILGQIMWAIGGLCFTFGAGFKLISDILKYRTTDFDKESSLQEYKTLNAD